MAIGVIGLFGIVGLAYVARALNIEERPWKNWFEWRTEFQSKLTEVLPHTDLAKAIFGFVEVDLLGQGSEGVLIGNDGTLFTNQDLPTFRTNALAIEAQLLADIEDAHARVQAAGSDLTLVLLPDKRRVLASVFAAPIPAWISERYDRLIEGLQAAGMDVVPALPALAPLGAEAFMANDTHWQVAGAEAVADLTATHIRAKYPHLVDTNPYERDDTDLEIIE